MTKQNKMIALAALGGLVFLFFGMPRLVGVSEDGVPVEECRAVGAQLREVVAINPDQLINPRPGTLLMPPLFWGALGESERENLVNSLATQAACASDGNPMFETVEVRSSVDNQLLGSGTVLTFSEE